MHYGQLKVRQFHEAIGAPVTHMVIGDRVPHIPERNELRAKLILEEASETASALMNNELVEAIDGLCDLLVVTYGTAEEMDVDLGPHFQAVHYANMKKVSGPVREDGKQLKPKGWKPPDHQRILDIRGKKYD